MRLKSVAKITGSLFDLNRVYSLASDPCNILFVSDRTLAILAEFALHEVNWYGRYFVDYPSSNLALVLDQTDDAGAQVDEIARGFSLEVSGENVEIATAIHDLAQAIRDASCCDGIGGSGTGSTGSDDTGQDTGNDNGVDLPENIVNQADYEAYRSYKCRVANKIVDQARLDAAAAEVGNWAAMVSTSLSVLVTTLAALFFSPIPGARLTILAGVIILYTGSLSAAFSKLKDAITNNYNDLVCSLFDSGSVAAAESAFQAGLEAAIDGETTGEEAWFLKQVAWIFLSPDNLNQLFDDTSGIDYPTGAFDCSTCNPPGLEIYFQEHATAGPMGSGSLIADGTSRMLSSVDIGGGTHKITFGMYEAPGNTLSYGSNCNALPVGVSGATFKFVNDAPLGGGVFNAFISQCDGTPFSIIHPSGDLPVGDYGQVTYVDLTFDSPFAATVTLDNIVVT